MTRRLLVLGVVLAGLWFVSAWQAVLVAQSQPMAWEARCVTTTAWVPRGYTLVARRPVTVCAEAP